MPILLSLETSTDVCSVALHDNHILLAEAVIREPQAHASMLAPLIEKITSEANISMTRIQAVAIASGPGSYTGLRIGTSTAKGLCLALDLPLIAVGTLELLAYQGSRVNHLNGLLCPMIDARRMEVYCLVTNAMLEIVRPVSATIVGGGSFEELLERSPVLFFGNGSGKCREVITHPNAVFVDDIYPLASALGELAMKKLNAGKSEDLVGFKPFYLKEFVAKKPQPRS